MKQEEILDIVRKWNTAEEAEFRNFRCAKCQKKITEAWHVWLHEGGYKVEVHFCADCGKELGINSQKRK